MKSLQKIRGCAFVHIFPSLPYFSGWFPTTFVILKIFIGCYDEIQNQNQNQEVVEGLEEMESMEVVRGWWWWRGLRGWSWLRGWWWWRGWRG